MEMSFLTSKLFMGCFDEPKHRGKKSWSGLLDLDVPRIKPMGCFLCTLVEFAVGVNAL